MKKRLQGLIAGLLIGAILTSGMVFAKQATETISIIYDNIKILIDGKEYQPVDAKGNEVEPFIYNGTTYLPVRAVANAFNKAVYWDDEKKSVYLGKMNGKLEEPTVRLEDMISIAEKPLAAEILNDNYGNRYKHAVSNREGFDTLQYLVNAKYSFFKGTLYVPEGESNDKSVFIRIFADGKNIYTSPTMTKISAPVDINVDISGYNDIVIEFSDSFSWTGGFECCLGNAGFYQ